LLLCLVSFAFSWWLLPSLWLFLLQIVSNYRVCLITHPPLGHYSCPGLWLAVLSFTETYLKVLLGCGCSLVVEHLLHIWESLSLILRTTGSFSLFLFYFV
jgi:hypothetical protein